VVNVLRHGNYMATDYIPVNVPLPLLKEVDKVVANQSNGFRSRNEFCVHSIREILKEYRNNYQPKEGK